MLSDRLLASFFAAAAALMAALDAGLPLWRHLPIGDATDFAACAAGLTWYGLKALAQPPSSIGDHPND